MNLEGRSGPLPRQGGWSGPIGTIDDCLANMPAPLLMSSSGRGWRDLTLNCHPHSGHFELDLPPLDHFVVTLAQDHGARTEHGLDGRAHEHAVRATDICIYPALRRHRCWGTATARSPVYSARDPILQRLQEVLFAELQMPAHPAQPMFVEAVTEAMAIHLVRAWGRPLPTPVAPMAKLSTRTLSLVLEYMQQNLTAPIHLDDLAAIAGLSRFHFIRCFKATTRMTPMQFLDQTRIDYAKALLRKGGVSLAEVSYLAGFSDQSHFTRRFRLRVGLTPGAYAKSFRTTS